MNIQLHIKILVNFFNYLRLISLLFILLILTTSKNVFAIDVDEYLSGVNKHKVPNINLIDKNGINIASGKPALRLTDLTIGSGALSLTHTISNNSGTFSLRHGHSTSETSLFGFKSVFGPSYYVDSFSGGAYNAEIRRSHTTSAWQFMEDITPIKNIDTGKYNAMFRIKPNGVGYEPISDLREQLTEDENNLIYTKFDGTKIIFDNLGNGVHRINKVVYPNGFTITTHYSSSKSSQIQSVTSNNGLQLYYIYDTDSSHPTSIVALNNTIESCPRTSGGCNITGNWPTVTYTWPGGSPLGIDNHNINERSFIVTDAEGRTHEYVHGSVKANSDNTIKKTRLISIKSSGVEIKKYFYKDYPQPNISGDRYGLMFEFTTYIYGLLHKVNSGNKTHEYNFMPNGDNRKYSEHFDYYSHQGDQLYAETSRYYGSPFKIKKDNVIYFLTEDEQNKITSSYSSNSKYGYPSTGVKYQYGYDERGNLKRVFSGSILSMEKNFAIDCHNIKTCNQPIWLKDGNQSQTDFEYHEPSGKIAKITYPQVNNIRPQTRYFYQSFYATYKNASGSVIRSNDPIWLLVKTSFCQNGHANGDGCANANDEVITTYEYGSPTGVNNLFLTGVAITTNGKTQRTCYQNDKLGNRIGETAPKANLTQCY